MTAIVDRIAWVDFRRLYVALLDDLLFKFISPVFFFVLCRNGLTLT